jgi:phage gpG-like protein
MSFKVTEHKNGLSGLAAELQRKNEQFVQVSAEAMKDKLAENIRAMNLVVTGNLLASQKKEGSGAEASARSEADYSAAVNFGHTTASGSFVPARPFFTQAVDEVRTEMPRKAKEVFNK